jgi:hypothetical protein
MVGQRDIKGHELGEITGREAHTLLSEKIKCLGNTLKDDVARPKDAIAVEKKGLTGRQKKRCANIGLAVDQTFGRERSDTLEETKGRGGFLTSNLSINSLSAAGSPVRYLDADMVSRSGSVSVLIQSLAQRRMGRFLSRGE